MPRRADERLVAALWRYSALVLMGLLVFAAIGGAIIDYTSWIERGAADIRIRKLEARVDQMQVAEQLAERMNRILVQQEKIITLLGGEDAWTDLQGRGVREEGGGDHQDAQDLQ